MKQKLLSGNEAIARGAYEAGVRVAAAYPGTPSTQILEEIARYPEIYAQWSPNEKVAFEVGTGASLGGARTLVAMKHVGLNVAADPLFTLAYTGVNAGFVVVSADDPSMHSSQNEQDNRFYARAALIPMLEPSNSQEAKDFTGLAFEISEEFDTPVLLRMTTRVSHSKSLIEIGPPKKIKLRPYQKNAQKYVMVPAHARLRRQLILDRLPRLADHADDFPFNLIEWNSKEVGIITSGVSYQYAREVFPDFSILKLGMTYPLPETLIRSFAYKVKTLYVIEELEPFLEEQLKAMGIAACGKEIVPRFGELNPTILKDAFKSVLPSLKTREKDKEKKSQTKEPALEDLPVRPPVMCPGCPHRGIFYVLSKLKLTVMGDIGCYTLSALPPLQAMDTCLCMGAGVGQALGFEKASEENKGKAVAVIGDSTFVHSGITPLIDIVYNQGSSTVIILDNRTTAMTGCQDHPGTGVTLKGKKTITLDFQRLAKAIGVKSVRKVDPVKLSSVEKAIKEEVEKDGPSLIISERPCVLIEKLKRTPCGVDPVSCTGCLVCLKLGCPAISKADKQAVIDAFICNGCGLCLQVCSFKAIGKRGEKRGK